MYPAKPLTQLYLAMCDGDEIAAQQLMDSIQPKLIGLAQQMLAREIWVSAETANDLYSEACLRVVRSRIKIKNGKHLLNLFALMMRRIVVDWARAARSRGRAVSLDQISERQPIGNQNEFDFLDLKSGLSLLSQRDAEGARLIELRMVYGLEYHEIVDCMKLPLSTVKSKLRRATRELALIFDLSDNF